MQQNADIYLLILIVGILHHEPTAETAIRRFLTVATMLLTVPLYKVFMQ
jgi:hypothetical protein